MVNSGQECEGANARSPLTLCVSFRGQPFVRLSKRCRASNGAAEVGFWTKSCRSTPTLPATANSVESSATRRSRASALRDLCRNASVSAKGRNGTEAGCHGRSVHGSFGSIAVTGNAAKQLVEPRNWSNRRLALSSERAEIKGTCRSIRSCVGLDRTRRRRTAALNPARQTPSTSAWIQSHKPCSVPRSARRRLAGALVPRRPCGVRFWVPCRTWMCSTLSPIR